MSWARIDLDAAVQLLTQPETVVVDVRDPQAYAAARIKGAIQLDRANVDEFVEATAKTTPILVYCYHGFSSQSAAAWLEAQGFEAVYSLDGGFERWRVSQATDT